MGQCVGCDVEINEGRKFCGKECYRKNRSKLNLKHSDSTKKKIAKGNTGKRFSQARKDAIRKARMKSITDDQMQILKSLWEMKFVNPKIIMELSGVSARQYRRAVKEGHCEYEQIKFMPSDMYPDETRRLIKMLKSGVYVGKICGKLDRGQKQITNVAKKLGYEVVTRNPDAYKGEPSNLECRVLDLIESHGIELERQFSFRNFYLDGKVKGCNVAVEVHGDYWHCNPKVYTNGPINDMQKAALRRDFCKKSQLDDAGYHRVVVWENAYLNNPKEAIECAVSKIKRIMEAFDENYS